MRRFIFLLLIPAMLAAQNLPKDFWTPGARKTVNEKYQLVEFADTIVLQDQSFFGALFNRDVRLRLPFSSFAIVKINECKTQEKGPPICSDRKVEQKVWHARIMDGVPGCYGTQTNDPQQPFYFEDRSPEGVTIRGKPGMVINFWCRTAAVKQ